MKAVVAAGSLVAAIWTWDTTYNHRRVTTHLEGMLREIRHHTFR